MIVCFLLQLPVGPEGAKGAKGEAIKVFMLSNYTNSGWYDPLSTISIKITTGLSEKGLIYQHFFFKLFLIALLFS